MPKVSHIQLTSTGKEHRPWGISTVDCRNAALHINKHTTLFIYPIPNEKGAIRMHLENRKNVEDRIKKAHDELMLKLYGTTIEDPRMGSVYRDDYTKAMLEVQEKYGLEQGDPDFLEWMLTLVGRSPLLIDRPSEGDNADATNSTSPAREAVGEAPPSETE